MKVICKKHVVPMQEWMNIIEVLGIIVLPNVERLQSQWEIKDEG